MSTFALATLMLASTSYITPTPEGDVNAFIRFMWANEPCPGVTINFDKTMEQVGDLGQVLHWDGDRTRDEILVETRVAQAEYQQNRSDFCVSTTKLCRSYDPAYLRKVGVTD